MELNPHQQEDLRIGINSLLVRESQVPVSYPAVIVSVNGSTEVRDRVSYVWCRAYTQTGVFQVFNRIVQPTNGLPVIVGFNNSSVLEILSYNLDLLADHPNFGDLPIADKHARTHEPGGADVLNVYQRSLVPLKTYFTTGLTIGVAGVTYYYKGTLHRFAGTTIDLATYLPTAGNSVYLLVYLQASLTTIVLVSSLEVVTHPAIVPPVPELPEGFNIPSALIRLSSDQVAVLEDDIFDVRSSIFSGSIDTATATVGSVLVYLQSGVYSSEIPLVDELTGIYLIDEKTGFALYL